MKVKKSAFLSPSQKATICQLWNSEYPGKLQVTLQGFDDFLSSTQNHYHFLLEGNDSNIVGWAFTFDRDGDRWFSMIIDHTYQRQGLGSILLNLLKEKESRLNGWVIDHPNDVKQNGELYFSPLSFYIRNGFTPIPEIRLENEKISAIKIEWRKLPI
ncbi:MAG TPA: GNAT family N-acetyltransferase [Saprospiraceae bacterium]